ncbi:MAG TPA: hypothetical protein VFQ91_28985 [Bryobacteraceae bacterium]|nr:hypothetical protein [Bryobacteraceae bacterium]
MRFVLLSLLVAGAAHGQLAATDNGQLYFTSNLSLSGSDPQSKVYRLNETGLALVASGQGASIFSPAAINPLTSGDGTIVGYGMNTPCAGGSCGLFALPRTRFIVTGITLDPDDYNALAISRNGTFLAGLTFDFRTRILNPAASSKRELPQYFVFLGEPTIADDGSVVIQNVTDANKGLIYVVGDKDPAAIPGTQGATRARINPGGNAIAYERPAVGGLQLVLTDPVGTAQKIVAASPSAQFAFRATFANDGSLLYLVPSGSTAQAVLRRPSGDAQQLPLIPGGVVDAVIQGDGRGAWLVSASNQYLYVQLDSGAVTERIPASPSIQLSGYFGAPGSVVRMTGNGLNRDTILTAGGTRYPVQEHYGQTITMQIPWETPAQSGVLPLVVQGPGSPFLQQTNLTILPAPTISFERDLRTGVLQAAHQDFRGLVTESDPACPGETVHIFARNMGPVDQPVGSNQPSPSSPPATVITPMACYLRTYRSSYELNPAQGIEVPFAGLSAGSVGVYQIDVTIPLAWSTAKSLVSCAMPSPANSYGGDSADLFIYR